MKRTIAVFIDEAVEPVRLGTLRYEAQGARESAAFAYEPAWLASADRFTVDPALQLVPGPQFHRQRRGGSPFHAAITDTEPDGWGRRVILRDHAKRRQLARQRGDATPPPLLNSLDFLLAVDDLSRVGALRFCNEDGVFCRAPVPGRRTAPPLVELAQLLAASRAVETQSETEADLAYLRGRATSLGGLRPKCSVVDADGHLAIGKFPSVSDERPVTKGEVLALRLGARAGLRVAEARLVGSDGAWVALVRRFDRRPGGLPGRTAARSPGGGRRLYVSAATMLGVEPGEPGEHTYTEIVDALRVYGAAAQADIEELWRRIAFSIAITNVDDHLHNHGFLHVEHGKWRLSPAFDLNPFPDQARELKTWISEETGAEASAEALLSVAPYFRISPARAKTILGEVRSAVAGWREVGRALGMRAHELAQFADAFEHDALGR